MFCAILSTHHFVIDGDDNIHNDDDNYKDDNNMSIIQKRQKPNTPIILKAVY
jgi:hypothetical protein